MRALIDGFCGFIGYVLLLSGCFGTIKEGGLDDGGLGNILFVLFSVGRSGTTTAGRRATGIDPTVHR